MRALVIYDSFFCNTEQVARAIGSLGKTNHVNDIIDRLPLGTPPLGVPNRTYGGQSAGGGTMLQFLIKMVIYLIKWIKI